MGSRAAQVMTAGAAPRPAGVRSRRSREAWRRRLYGLLSVTVFLILWECSGRQGWINPLFTSSPSQIAIRGWELLSSGKLTPHLWISTLEFLGGFGLAILVGVPVGMIYGWYPGIKAVLDPFISGLYATPMIALLPLLLIAFGIGPNSKIAVIFLGSVFPILINTGSGMGVLDAHLVKAARSFGASSWQLFLTIGLPSCVPFVVAGLRLAVGRALIGVVVGEMYAGTSGIGYILAAAGQTFETDTFFVGVLIVVLAGYALTEGLRRLEQRFAAWRPQN